MQVEVINDLTSTPRNVMELLPCENIPLAQHLIREAASVGRTYQEIFLKFADVHFAINHAKVVTSDDLRHVG